MVVDVRMPRRRQDLAQQGDEVSGPLRAAGECHGATEEQCEQYEQYEQYLPAQVQWISRDGVSKGGGGDVARYQGPRAKT